MLTMAPDDDCLSAASTEVVIDIRKADYFDYDSLLRAYRGIDKLMLVAAHAFTDRNTQHYNAITAARQAGVKHIVFTSIIRKEGSNLVLPGVTESDIFGEETLKASGVPYTIARQAPFVESLQFYITDKAFDVGVRVPAGKGKTSTTSRDDLGAAHAATGRTWIGYSAHWRADNDKPALTNFLKILDERYPSPAV